MEEYRQESLRALYERIERLLEEAGCDSPAFDASCLLETFTGVGRAALPVRGGRPAAPEESKRLWEAARERAEGRPLQYILGEWDFLDLTLSVGEGVLIPRPDSELLCETAASLLKDGKGEVPPAVLDLCAGSGCISLGIARLVPGARVTAVELSGEALPYLRRNIERYPALSVTPVRGDVLMETTEDGGASLCAALRPDSAAFDAIVSNPPYIPTADLPILMREVKREPVMALDGGDGYVFYRVITERWLSRLKPGGLCAVEVGLGQAETVAGLFRTAGLSDVAVYRDLSGIERVVAGRRP